VVATMVGGHAAHDPAALFDDVAAAEANRPDR
jgi:hypothetical protein